ncbi:glycerol-3-phosphate acyltransferase, putative [Eimeria necatrix]|uniref:Glycerol-3-phosphate acyltransferase, putative n=1 Tax=Eimeria necatrix TaxID=51315 RepID=U6MJ22_9EIME|nr:glycerol-3-phosphate acyltransferase, putative [Eimeria necatrix]CDJ63053.1 glycerol-3-phosphate acyltransferase, putative [Eimeria necatrix]
MPEAAATTTAAATTAAAAAAAAATARAAAWGIYFFIGRPFSLTCVFAAIAFSAFTPADALQLKHQQPAASATLPAAWVSQGYGRLMGISTRASLADNRGDALSLLRRRPAAVAAAGTAANAALMTAAEAADTAAIAAAKAATAAKTTTSSLFPYGLPPALSPQSAASPKTAAALDEAKEVIEREMWRLYYTQQQQPQQKQQKLLSAQQVEQLIGFSRDFCNSAKISGKANAVECVVKLLSVLQQCMRCSSYVFSAFSAAQKSPMDFTEWSLSIWEPLIDLENSKLHVSEETLLRLSRHLRSGGNAVLLSNHQTEPDPLLARLLFRKRGFNDLYEALTAVAGYRVRSDLLSVPFSMSCDMICVHSKKHLSSGADGLEQQRRENVQAMQALQHLLEKGGSLIWVAPSGGRDRANQQGVYAQPDPFDAKTVQTFSLFAKRARDSSGHKTLFFPMAVYTAPICPPPKEVAKELGETRSCNYSPIGLAIGEPLEADLSSSLLTAKAEEQTRALYSAVSSFPS